MNDVDTRSGSGALGAVVGFLGGALVGTVLTLLVAPRSGTETRRRIAGKAASSRDALARVGSAAKQVTATAQAAFTTALHEESAPDGWETGASPSPRSSAR